MSAKCQVTRRVQLQSAKSQNVFNCAKCQVTRRVQLCKDLGSENLSFLKSAAEIRQDDI